MKEIRYYKKNVYGNEHIYIKDIDIADLVQGLTGKKTINISDMQILQALGFTMVQVLPE